MKAQGAGRQLGGALGAAATTMLVGLLAASCVPGEDGKTYASVAVNITPNGSGGGPDVATTADGWSLTVTRFLFQGLRLDVMNCGGVANQLETTVQSALVPFELSVNQITPGTCGQVCLNDFFYSDGTPQNLTPGPGTSAADVALLAASKAAAYFEAVATRGPTTKRVALTFDFVPYLCCQASPGPPPTITTVGAHRQTFAIELHPERLFRDNADPATPEVLRFDAYAAADDRGNGDGIVTTSELSVLQLGDLPTPPGLTRDQSHFTLESLASAQFGVMFQFEGTGSCAFQ